jgi:hypothetical protein
MIIEIYTYKKSWNIFSQKKETNMTGYTKITLAKIKKKKQL